MLSLSSQTFFMDSLSLSSLSLYSMYFPARLGYIQGASNGPSPPRSFPSGPYNLRSSSSTIFFNNFVFFLIPVFLIFLRLSSLPPRVIQGRLKEEPGPANLPPLASCQERGSVTLLKTEINVGISG